MRALNHPALDPDVDLSPDDSDFLDIGKDHLNVGKDHLNVGQTNHHDDGRETRVALQ